MYLFSHWVDFYGSQFLHGKTACSSFRQYTACICSWHQSELWTVVSFFAHIKKICVSLSNMAGDTFLHSKCQYFSCLPASPQFKGQVAANVHLWYFERVRTHTHTHIYRHTHIYGLPLTGRGDASHECFSSCWLRYLRQTWRSLGWFLNKSRPQTSGFEIFIIKSHRSN